MLKIIMTCIPNYWILIGAIIFMYSSLQIKILRKFDFYLIIFAAAQLGLVLMRPASRRCEMMF